MDLDELLALAVKAGASDLHLSAGLPPMIRLDGTLSRPWSAVFSHHDVIERLYVLMNEEQRHAYESRSDVDFSFERATLARFRVNAFHQSRGAAAVFRILPLMIPTLSALNLPPIFTEMASFKNGLILITGPTGSGKSTTLAAMVDHMNQQSHHHILTLEDPIEFVHACGFSLVNQREIHRDTSFSTALRSALREDPDVILIGELRDLETIRLALTAAETGHLVLATLHTNSATNAIHRIIDVFPGDEKATVRSMLADSLQAVVAQQLLKKIGGGRIAALEIMGSNAAIRHLIREDKLAQLYSVIQTGQLQGMMTLDQHLTRLVAEGMIARETALGVAVNNTLFN